MTNKIIFTTAFYDIGRSDWGPFSRTHSKYIQQFNNMINDGFDEYILIVYSHPHVIRDILDSRPSYPPNILFVDITNVDTFLKEPYLSSEAEIMKNPKYIEKISERRRMAIEHTYPKYTLLTHSKICFLGHSKKILPNYEFYAWIDFGYPVGENICGWPPCPYPAVPKNINFDLLDEGKLHIASYRVFEDKCTEEEFLRYNCFTFYAFSFILHESIVEIFYQLYVQKLEEWRKRIIADDEQVLMYQIFQDRPDLFKVFHIGRSIWGLFPDNLNGDASERVSVLHPPKIIKNLIPQVGFDPTASGL